MLLGRMHMEVRQIRRIDEALQEAHGPKTLQLQLVPEIFQQVGSSVSSYEEALMAHAFKG